MKIITTIAPVNIAVIKYWGKRDENLILPLNDSISATLSTDVMCARTTIFSSRDLKENKFWLNGKEEDFYNSRVTKVIEKARELCIPSLPNREWKYLICSENNFPTAAGLASSAAGYACMAYALSAMFELPGMGKEVSQMARVGSGSACRSLHGGWVRWYKGDSLTGSDSIARPIASETHWPEMRVLILVVNDSRKKYGSTVGMRQSVETSTLLQHRVDKVLPKRIEDMSNAILEKNFHTFAEITMKDSNQFHAICLDTYPPCNYLNDVSHSIINLVHTYNTYKKENKVAYTFDAGPNACLFMLESELKEFFSIVNYVFPQPDNVDGQYFRGIDPFNTPIEKEIIEKLRLDPNEKGKLKNIICSKLGSGPVFIYDRKEYLLEDNGTLKTPKKE